MTISMLELLSGIQFSCVSVSVYLCVQVKESVECVRDKCSLEVLTP